MGEDTFRRIFSAGLTAVDSGSHRIERDPRETRRWAPSIVLLPSADVRGREDRDLTREPDGLRSTTSLGVHTFDALRICCWKYEGTGVVPQVAASVPARPER